MQTQKIFTSVLGAMLVFIAVSCGEDYRENAYQKQDAGPYLRADISSVTVPAQEMKAAPTDKAVIISSNRSWTASLEPAVEWVRVSCTSGPNEGHAAKKTMVVFSFDMYESEDADRQTVLKLKGEDGLSLELPVVQRKAIPIPLIFQSSAESVTALAEMPGGAPVVKNLTITTNISWTAAFEPAVDWVSIAPTAHEQEDREENKVDVALTFQPNESITDGRSTTLVLTAADNKGRLEIPLVQNKKEATVQWVSEATDFVSTAAGSVTLEFIATAAWTASLESAADGISLSATSGDPTVSSLDVNFTEFQGPGAIRSATVVLSLSNGVKDRLQVRQIGTELYLDFTGGNQPFTTDINYGVVTKEEKEYILACNGNHYAFSFCSATDNGYTFVNAADGKTCGLLTYKNDWVKLPGVEGMKLKSAEVYTSNMGSSASKGYGLRETPDGANLKALWVAAHGEWCNLVLDNPVAGQRYYLVSLNNTGYFSKMHLIYE